MLDINALIEQDLKKSSDLTEIALFIEQFAKPIGAQLFPDDPFIENIPDLFTVTFHKPRLTRFASNKDSCPYGKKSNPTRTKADSLSYPAITGRLKLQRIKGSYPYFSIKRILNAMNIYINSGKYHMPFTMWVDDFPSLGVMWVLSGGEVLERDDLLLKT